MTGRELWRMNITGWSPDFRAHCKAVLAEGVGDGTYTGDDRYRALILLDLIRHVEREPAVT